MKGYIQEIEYQQNMATLIHDQREKAEEIISRPDFYYKLD